MISQRGYVHRPGQFGAARQRSAALGGPPHAAIALNRSRISPGLFTANRIKSLVKQLCFSFMTTAYEGMPG